MLQMLACVANYHTAIVAYLGQVIHYFVGSQVMFKKSSSWPVHPLCGFGEVDTPVTPANVTFSKTTRKYLLQGPLFKTNCCFSWQNWLSLARKEKPTFVNLCLKSLSSWCMCNSLKSEKITPMISSGLSWTGLETSNLLQKSCVTDWRYGIWKIWAFARQAGFTEKDFWVALWVMED